MLVAVGTVNLRNHEVASQELAHLLYGVAKYHLVGDFHREGVQSHGFQVALAALCLVLLLLLINM